MSCCKGCSARGRDLPSEKGPLRIAAGAERRTGSCGGMFELAPPVFNVEMPVARGRLSSGLLSPSRTSSCINRRNEGFLSIPLFGFSTVKTSRAGIVKFRNLPSTSFRLSTARHRPRCHRPKTDNSHQPSSFKRRHGVRWRQTSMKLL